MIDVRDQYFALLRFELEPQLPFGPTAWFALAAMPAQPLDPLEPCLVGRRLFYRGDHEDRYIRFSGIELQSDLLLNGRE
jgi:hypothetical protein